ncbi:MAG: hypothetical protein AAGA56_02535 [Myxococcota bacterium]
MCRSGFCVDGICCDAACDGACESCQGEATDAPDGACAPRRVRSASPLCDGICSGDRRCLSGTPEWAEVYVAPGDETAVYAIGPTSAGGVIVAADFFGSDIDLGDQPWPAAGLVLAEVGPETSIPRWSASYPDFSGELRSLTSDNGGRILLSGVARRDDLLFWRSLGIPDPSGSSSSGFLFLAAFRSSDGQGAWAKEYRVGSGTATILGTTHQAAEGAHLLMHDRTSSIEVQSEVGPASVTDGGNILLHQTESALVRAAGYAGGEVFPQSLADDPIRGGVYLAGTTSGEAFGTPVMGEAGYVASFFSDYQTRWVATLAAADGGPGFSTDLYQVAADPAWTRVNLMAYANATATVAEGPPLPTAAGQQIVGQLDDSGGHAWSVGIPQPSFAEGTMGVGPRGDVVAAFFCEETVAAGELSVDAGRGALCAVRFTRDGDPLWLRFFSCSDPDMFPTSVVVAESGVFISGSFIGSLEVGGEVGTLTTNGQDLFLLKLRP